MTTQPGHGHLQPMAPYARALMDAGDEVKVATAPSFAEAVERLGLEAVPAGPDFTWERAAETFPALSAARTTAEADEVVREIVWGRSVPGVMADLRELMDRWRPDLVLREAAEHGGTLAALRIGVPTVVALWGAVATDPAWEQTVVPYSFIHRRWNARARELELTQTAEEYLAAEPALSCLPPSWIPDDLPRVQPVHHFRMPPLDGAADGAQWTPPASGRPLIYATLGTVYTFDRRVRATLLEALGDVDADVLFTVGRSLDPATIDAPPNVTIERYVPQSLVLEHAALVVSHGGLGTVIGAVAAGVPMVLVDLGGDHAVNTGRAVAVGVAEAFRRDELGVDAVRDAVRRMLGDPGPRARSRTLAAELAELPPAAAAVPLLRAIAAGRSAAPA